MKKSKLFIMATAILTALFITGCSSQNAGTPETTGESKGSSVQTSKTDSTQPEETQASETTQETETPKVTGVAEIVYSNVDFDFSQQIADERAAVKLVPDTLELPISVADANGATGVQLVASLDESSTSDYYLNALVAGNALVFTAADGSTIASAKSSISGDVTVTDNTISIVPAPIQAAEPTDEIITITMEDGNEYNIHTLHESMPGLVITGEGVDEANAGVYDFAVDKFLFRVNTDGELVYYRDMNSVGELMAENFGRQVTSDGSYFTCFVELHKDYRNANGGYSSGMYVVMDENYKEIDYVTLQPNTDPNHTHGEGYLDQHEFLVLGKNHYITLSYTPQLISNLPKGVAGLDGGNTAYVWAGIFQEVKDGQVLHEISTTDYPMLYESAVEKIDYANSTDQGIEVNINNEMVPSPADGWMDYVHTNSIDYTLDVSGQTDKLLVSMRDQCAVYQFDIKTGEIEWILGGKASTLTGYDEFTSSREDEKGSTFTALTYAQHYARYTNKNADGTLSGDPVISIFDNQTGAAPFLTVLPVPTLTRTLKVTIDEAAKTAAVSDVLDAVDMNEKTGTYHIASHCGSVDYVNENSVVTGWGLHGVIDNIGAMAPEGTISDAGFDDLRAGSRPIFTEYDVANDKVTFELSAVRNANYTGHEAMFSYRTYKTAQ